MYLGLNGWLAAWRIDPSDDRLCRRFGLLSDEAFGVSAEGTIEGYLPGGMDLVGQTVMHLVGRHQADASMVMVLIVPIEEAATEGLCVLDAAEALRKLRLIFHGFEVAFRERVVVGGVRPAVGFGDAEIGEQQCRGLGSHRTTAVGVQSELAFRRGMFGSASSNNAANKVALSRSATHQPTTRRLKMSMMT